jgi:formate hydrogenlyase subunit 4
MGTLTMFAQSKSMFWHDNIIDFHLVVVISTSLDTKTKMLFAVSKNLIFVVVYFSWAARAVGCSRCDTGAVVGRVSSSRSL